MQCFGKQRREGSEAPEGGRKRMKCLFFRKVIRLLKFRSRKCNYQGTSQTAISPTVQDALNAKPTRDVEKRGSETEKADVTTKGNVCSNGINRSDRINEKMQHVSPISIVPHNTLDSPVSVSVPFHFINPTALTTSSTYSPTVHNPPVIYPWRTATKIVSLTTPYIRPDCLFNNFTPLSFLQVSIWNPTLNVLLPKQASPKTNFKFLPFGLPSHIKYIETRYLPTSSDLCPDSCISIFTNSWIKMLKVGSSYTSIIYADCFGFFIISLSTLPVSISTQPFKVILPKRFAAKTNLDIFSTSLYWHSHSLNRLYSTAPCSANQVITPYLILNQGIPRHIHSNLHVPGSKPIPTLCAQEVSIHFLTQHFIRVSPSILIQRTSEVPLRTKSFCLPPSHDSINSSHFIQKGEKDVHVQPLGELILNDISEPCLQTSGTVSKRSFRQFVRNNMGEREDPLISTQSFDKNIDLVRLLPTERFFEMKKSKQDYKRRHSLSKTDGWSNESIRSMLPRTLVQNILKDSLSSKYIKCKIDVRRKTSSFNPLFLQEPAPTPMSATKMILSELLEEFTFVKGQSNPIHLESTYISICMSNFQISLN